ncbi:MAG: DUF2310 family Zn-ribbon-containing protein [Chitinophagaceae bacterium]|nr:DUF2310 family Zn-ribbon-containing protein [Chitinophagaceae bacterium]
MFKQKVSILINTKHSREELLNEFEFLLGSLCKTGQILKKYESPYIENNEIVSFQRTHESTSLSKKYHNEYVNAHWNNLEKWCNSKLMVKRVATYPSCIRLSCKCKNPGFYVLFTHTFNDLSPVQCGECRRSVPLYKIKGLTSDELYEILSWETNYKACDDLQLGCRVGEQWATKQMSDAFSQLSKQGIANCISIKRATGAPAYYYLFNYKNISKKVDRSRKCPSCKGDWLINDNAEKFHNFLCKKCNLISSFTSNSK